MEVKPAEFARLAGVSRASISGKIKNKTLIVNAAGLLDTDNPINAAYLSKHRQNRSNEEAAAYVQSAGSKSFTGETFKPPGGPPDDFALAQVAGVPAREMLNMTLRDIVLKYPGLDKIERYSKILKDITMSAEREQRIQERSLTLIPKNFVTSRIFGFIDGLTKQIIEYPESVVDRIIALANNESQTTRIDIVDIMTAGISQLVTGAKDSIVAELNGLKNKYQNDIDNHNQIEELKEAIQEARE